MTEPCLEDIDVVILAGGLGTRIQGVLGDTPKLLAPVGAAPFLDLLILRLKSFGARRLVLGLGHLAEKVTAHLNANPHLGIQGGVDIITATEPEPLGTAGALRFVRPHIKTNPVMVMNGDSFFAADLCEFVTAHRSGGTEGSILCAPVDDTARFGRLDISVEGRVQAFLEKNATLAGPGIINAGVYLFSAAMLDAIDERPGPSLERDVFEQLPPGTLGAVTGEGAFIDIGTPGDLARAADVLAPFSDT
ncbi:MAG: NTP transferase domain-containing protein [Rhodospirillales bacterium]|nr:NTP transferase domain-containing protein [Rhodospirillales bacterium]